MENNATNCENKKCQTLIRLTLALVLAAKQLVPSKTDCLIFVASPFSASLPILATQACDDQCHSQVGALGTCPSP